MRCGVYSHKTCNMTTLPFITFAISCLIYPVQPAVVLPDCPDDFASAEESSDLDSLAINLPEGHGLATESFCWYYDKDEKPSDGHLHHEYLFDQLIHFEVFPKNKQQKTVIVVNGTEHAFEANLTSSKDSTKCNSDIMKSSPKWNADSVHLLSDLTTVSEHLSLSWILANVGKRSWVRKDNAEQVLASFVSCEDGGSEIQMTFLSDGESPVLFDNLIQVLVVPQDKDTKGYYLFDVYNVDEMDPKNTNPIQLQQSLGIFQSPEGISCDSFMIQDQLKVEFPDQMSMSTELVDFEHRKIYYTSEFYDYNEKLVRIELHSGYTPGYVSPRHSRPQDDVDPVKYIRDFEYGLGFWRDMDTGDCGIHVMNTNHDDISKEMFPNQVDYKNKDNVTSTVTLYKMTHPHEIYNFKDLHYTGRCLSQSYVTGLRYIQVINDKLTEVCVADGNWTINTLNTSISMPFYRKTFNLSKPREAPDFTPVVEQVTHFYDVEFHEPDPSYFDISDCVDTSLTRHYILRTKSSTKLLDPKNNNDALPEEKQRSPMFQRMPRFTSAMKSSLQKFLNVPGVRVFDVFAEEPLTGAKETNEHTVIIGFAILDFPPEMSSTYDSEQMDAYRARGVYQGISAINMTMYQKQEKKEFVLNFKWEDYYRDADGKTVSGMFREKMTVDNIMEVTKTAFAKVAPKDKEMKAPAKQEGEGIGAGAVVAVAFCMTLLGVGIGMALGWKLWKSGTSFGYTIHTNI